uniref:Uncharacterized protein n=1 Tax=Anguilla anguilla TaxID=7936 RepID=A0A0E9SAZ7_ANGAN
MKYRYVDITELSSRSSPPRRRRKKNTGLSTT